MKAVKMLLFAPILGFIEIVTLPLAAFGYVFWILLCQIFDIPPYAIGWQPLKFTFENDR